MKARLRGTLPDGTKVFEVPVRVLLNSSRECRTLQKVDLTVLARSVVEAANFVRNEYRLRPETDIIAYGVRGGEVRRHIGWDSATWAAMCDAHDVAREQRRQQSLLEAVPDGQ